uniref:Uncharacterized protein n=1 Tax=Rhizophora mucronata TaxID=61149 RepID=A0A2P2NIH4_RHIMU
MYHQVLILASFSMTLKLTCPCYLILHHWQCCILFCAFQWFTLMF